MILQGTDDMLKQEKKNPIIFAVPLVGACLHLTFCCQTDFFEGTEAGISTQTENLPIIHDSQTIILHQC